MDGVTLRKAHDYYGKLRAFAIMLVTDDEQTFCDCYKIASGFDKPKMEAGHQTWNMMKYGFAYWRNKDYLTYTTKPTMETRGVDDNYRPPKPKFKITFEPIEE